MMELSYPDDFRCPISLEVMSDPVILTSGHTFDRPSIQRWLDSGNLTCPLTNLPLSKPHPLLIPNHALRRLISSFAPQTPPKSPSCPLDIPTLSFPSDPAALTSILRSVQKNADLRRKIAHSKVPSVLLRHVSSPNHPELQKLAISSLLFLSLETDDIKVGLVAEGAVDHLVAAVDSNVAAAATLITNLATVDVNKVTIGAHPSAIASLVAMLLEGKGMMEKREAATAIYELCKFPLNRKRAVRAGLVRPLVKLARSGSNRAVAVLGLLAKTREGREEMVRVPGFVRLLVGVLGSGTYRGVEGALLVLNRVCVEDEKMGLEAIEEGVLEVLGRFLVAGEEVGASRSIGKNAVTLVRILWRKEL